MSVLLSLGSGSASAAIPAVAKKDTVIYAEPSFNARAVGRLPAITKVNVLGKKGAEWFKISIILKNGKTVEGWTLKSNLYNSESGAKVQRREEQNLLETLINRRSKEQPKKSKAPPPEVAKYREQKRPEQTGGNWLHDRLDAGMALGYRINSYELSDASNAIAYDIPGLFLGVNLQFNVLQRERWAAGVKAGFEYEVKNYTIELLDDAATPQLISSTDGAGSTTVFDVGLVGTWKFTPSATSPEATLELGYLISSSMMDDGQVRNLPVNLFVNSDYTHLYVGAGFALPFKVADTIAGLKLNGQYFVLNDFEESTDAGATNVSGNSPTAAPGYFVKVGFFWNFTDHLIAELAFMRKQEGADFTGNGTRLVNTSQAITFTDASVSEVVNGALLGVTYDF